MRFGAKLYWLLPALLLSACEPQLEDPAPAAANSNSSLLATKGDRRNPFSIAVMREAVRNLRRGKAGKDGLLQTQSTTQPQITDPCPNCVEDPAPTDPCPSCDHTPEPSEGTPTHYYVRLKPANVDQLADLADLGVNLSLVPLNEDAAANYQVPETDEIPWLYTAIPSDYSLPQGIQQERLEDLFLYNADDADAQDMDPWEPEPPTDCYSWDPVCKCYASCSTVSDPPAGVEHSPNKKNTASRPATGKPKRNRVKEATAYLRQLGISPAALYAEAMRITGHEEELLPASLGRPATGKQLATDSTFPSLAKTAYTASGTIRVEEYYRTSSTDVARRNVPLVNVWVEARRWFKQDGAFTNNNGQFSISTNFQQKAHVLVRFKNGQLTTRGNSAAFKPWLSVLPIQHDLGMYTGTQMQGLAYLFTYQANANSKGALSWTAATLFNSRAEMQTYTAARNIPAPPSGLNVFLSSDITKSASAPMLRRIAETSLASRAIDAILAGSTLGGIIILKQVLQRQLPDITCRFGGVNGSSTQTTNDLNNTFYHEFAHTIHYSQVGNNYWVAYINYIINNATNTSRASTTYGYKTDNGAERIAISEGWAYFTGESFTFEKYRVISPYVSNVSRNKLEDQRPLNNTSDYRNWVIYGLYYDMTDNVEIFDTGVTDNVNAYNIAQIFGALQSDVISVRQFHNRVLQHNNYLQSPEMAQLVSSYLY